MTTNGRPAVSFAKLDRMMDMPHFLDVQREAFDRLLQLEELADVRRDLGLERVFNEIFPIGDANGNFSLEFISYSLGEPKYGVEECIERDMTYAAPLKARLRLIAFETIGEDPEKRPGDIVEKEVYLGELPLLTSQGTFVVNGADRVIVSQLHRSPGVVFEESVHPNGTRLFSSRIIPFRGSWVEFTLDIHDVIHVHIDKKKKFPATALLRAFGYGRDVDILDLFYKRREVVVESSDSDSVARREVTGTLIATTILNEEYEPEAELLELSGYEVDPEALNWLAVSVLDPSSSEIIGGVGDVVDAELIRRFEEAGIETVSVFKEEEAFIIRRGSMLTEDAMDRLERAGVTQIEVYSSATFVPLRGSYEELAMRRDWSSSPQLAADVVANDTGEVLADKGTHFDAKLFEKLKNKKAREALVFTGGPRGESPLLRNTLAKDPTGSEAAALHSIYSLVRPGEAPNLETARTALDGLFFNPTRYDLGLVGRHKVNHRLKDVYRLLDFPLPEDGLVVLAPSDFVAILRYLIELHEGRGYTDDIDHLGNRRVRSIGELIANQFSVGLSRMARLVRERMSINSGDEGGISIDDLVNATPLAL